MREGCFLSLSSVPYHFNQFDSAAPNASVLHRLFHQSPGFISSHHQTPFHRTSPPTTPPLPALLGHYGPKCHSCLNYLRHRFVPATPSHPHLFLISHPTSPPHFFLWGRNGIECLESSVWWKINDRDSVPFFLFLVNFSFFFLSFLAIFNSFFLYFPLFRCVLASL